MPALMSAASVRASTVRGGRSPGRIFARLELDECEEHCLGPFADFVGPSLRRVHVHQTRDGSSSGMADATIAAKSRVAIGSSFGCM
jgi:hypothetical protein